LVQSFLIFLVNRPLVLFFVAGLASAHGDRHVTEQIRPLSVLLSGRVRSYRF
jgi:hypothetical protein